jgi:hypothetical protein
MTTFLWRRCLGSAWLGGWLLVAWACSSDDGECYAPGKNLDTAYEPGAVGCECAPNTEGVCSDGTALVCEQGHWQAVIDGPCFPGPGEPCGDGFCSRSGYCEEAADAGAMCEAKKEKGAACSEGKECLSDACADGSCK